MVTVGQQALRRDFGARVHGTEVLREVAHPAQTSGPVGRLAASGLGGPRQCQLGRDEGGLRRLGKAHKLTQFTARGVQFKAEAVTQLQILFQVSA